MSDVAYAVEHGDPPDTALAEVADLAERETLRRTVEAMSRLHREGRNHIWAYYTRNLVRPVSIAEQKVDRIVGNPPWLTYNKTVATLRTELERLSRETDTASG